MLEQHNANIDLALDCSLMQRSVAPRIFGIWIGSGLQQKRNNLGVSKGAGIVQGYESTVISGQNVGSHRQQMLHGLATSIAFLNNF